MKKQLCSYCHTNEVYAKSLCKNCYNRQRRHGTPKYTRQKYHIGDCINGWTIIDNKPPRHYTLQCNQCNATVIKSVDCMRYLSKHRCCFKFSECMTARQKEIVSAFIKNDYKYTETAKKLGLTRQRVYKVVDELRIK